MLRNATFGRVVSGAASLEFVPINRANKVVLVRGQIFRWLGQLYFTWFCARYGGVPLFEVRNRRECRRLFSV